MVRVLNIMLAMLIGAATARASPYWIDWEGDDWPENQGWTRVWGNWDGQYHGPGANRTLEDGILTYDSLYDPGVYDFSRMYRPGQMDPSGPEEMFVAEWRLKVSQVVGRADPTVGIFSDGAWALGLEFGYDRLYSVFEDYLVIPFEAGVFHSYRVVSPNMQTYELYIDYQLVRQGAFVNLVVPSEIGWGDGVQGAASLHSWDYFRFGVTPEPSSALVLVFSGACYGRRRAFGLSAH